MEEAESLVKKVLDELPTHATSGVTCSPSFLIERTKECLDVIDNATSAFSLYNNDPSGKYSNVKSNRCML